MVRTFRNVVERDLNFRGVTKLPKRRLGEIYVCFAYSLLFGSTLSRRVRIKSVQNTLLVGMLVFCLSACDDPPAPVDPMTGLGNVSPTSSAQNLRPLLGANVALVLSENTRNLVNYQGNFAGIATSSEYSDQTNAMLTAAGDTQALAAGPVLILKKYFPNIWLAESINNAKSRGASFVVLLDMSEGIKNSFFSLGSSDIINVSNQLIFIQLQNPGGVMAEIDGKSTNSCPADQLDFDPNAGMQSFAQCILDARKTSLTNLEENTKAQFSP